METESSPNSSSEVSTLDLFNQAAAEKAFSAEKNISIVRAIIVVFYSIIYYLFIDKSGHNLMLAVTITTIALSYSFYVIYYQPYKKYPVFRASYFTTVSDAFLISCWISATGYFNSPFYLLWYFSIIATAFRYSATITSISAIGYSLLYILLLVFGDHFFKHSTEILFRSANIFIFGLLASTITRETFHQTKEKILMKRLAEETRQAKDELKIQTDLYETLLTALSTMGEGISIFEENSFVYCNDAMCKILQYSREELFKLSSVAEIVQDTEQEKIKQQILSSFQSNQLEFGETILKRKDGKKVNVVFIFKAINLGNRTQIISLIRDITARKSEEENLVKLASIVETSEDAIIYIDSKERIVNWNHGAEKIFGYTEAEIKGQPINVLIPDNLKEESVQMILKIKNGEHIGHYETIRLKKDGSQIHLSLSLSAIRDKQGNLKGISKIGRDITVQKLNEFKLLQKSKELARSNAELEMFAFAASHDLQEPLRKIRLFGDLLESKYSSVLDETGLNYIQRMQGASERMQELINDVLTLSRLSNQSEVDFVKTDLNEIIKSVLTDLELNIKSKNAHIHISELPVITAVPMQMRQLFTNLLSNALKYSKSTESPSITIEAEIVKGKEVESLNTALRQKNYCRIYVSDNGIGFDQKYSRRIFLMFQRLHKNNEYSGSGIGLAICKKIVENHQGFIEVKSEENIGSTFIITLPVKHIPSTEELA